MVLSQGVAFRARHGIAPDPFEGPAHLVAPQALVTLAEVVFGRRTHGTPPPKSGQRRGRVVVMVHLERGFTTPKKTILGFDDKKI